jgi:ribosomal protein L40E
MEMTEKKKKLTNQNIYYKICVNCGATNEVTSDKLCKECGYPHDRHISNLAKKIANWLTK